MKIKDQENLPGENTQPTEINNLQPVPVVDVEKPRRIKRLHLYIGLICFIAVIWLGIIGFAQWYSKQDHSPFKNLTSVTYNKNGVYYSFNYPKIFLSGTKRDKSVIASLIDTPLVYSYGDTKNNEAVIIGNYSPDNQTLNQLNLTPIKVIDQIKAGKGSYISYLNSVNANIYKSLYQYCKKTITTNSGQTVLLCESTFKSVQLGFSGTLIQVIGITSTYQYNLIIGMTNNIWTSHQQVWQKVEKSFNFQ